MHELGLEVPLGSASHFLALLELSSQGLTQEPNSMLREEANWEGLGYGQNLQMLRESVEKKKNLPLGKEH